MRNKCKNLFIFIDSLPYYYREKMSFVSSYPYHVKIKPGLGYSINLYWEIFGGLKPDKIGFFNTWGYDPLNAPLKRIKLASPLLKHIKRGSILYRVLRKLLCNILGMEAFGLPLETLCYFKKSGRSIFSEKSSLQSNNLFHGLAAEDLNLLSNREIWDVILPAGEKQGRRDESVYLQAMKAMESVSDKSLLLWFPDLDGIGHGFGVGSKEYQQRIDNLDMWIEELKNKAIKIHGFDDVIIFSDHGMSNVSNEISLVLENKLGKTGDKTYDYFLDSTILRAWINNPSYYEPLLDHLKSLHIGTVLDYTYREQNGICSKVFGDIVFILNEGSIFSPTTLSVKTKDSVKAMHGYLPELESQKGIFLSFRHKLVNNDQIGTSGLHQVLKGII